MLSNILKWLPLILGISLTSIPALALSHLKNVTPVLNEQAYTPNKGSAERQSIMEALRAVVKKMSELDVIFIVTHLKVKNNWAWAEVQPQSKDGTQHYEPLTGLLHKKDGQWRYVEGPPEWTICEEDPDCSDSARYFKKLLKKYTAASADIFPK
jgi:hypothetical protein